MTKDGLTRLKGWARDGLTDEQIATEYLGMDKTIEELRRSPDFEFVGNESQFEDNIFEHIEDICVGLHLPRVIVKQRQVMIPIEKQFTIRPDIVVRHEDYSCTIFEVKKANDKYPSTGTSNQMNAVGQLLLYGNVFEAIIKTKPRLALIDNKIYYRTMCAFMGNKLPITLIDFQKDRVFVPYFGW